jgi:hypothetical protein
MIVDIQDSSGMGPVEWRAIRTRLGESNMKIKTNIRAGQLPRSAGCYPGPIRKPPLLLQ